MAVQSLPVEKFKTGATVMGIPGNVVMLSLMLIAPVLMLLNGFVGGVPFLVIGGLLYYYVFLKLAEYLIEVVPPNIFQHILDWVIAGDVIYTTNDVDPIPHLMLTNEEVQKDREQRVRDAQSIR